MVNVISSGTHEITNGTVVDVQINLNLIDKSVKVMVIETNGQLIFAGHPMFTDNTDTIRILARGAGVDTPQAATLITAQKVYNIAPLMIAGGETFNFTITNASGANRLYQIDLLV